MGIQHTAIHGETKYGALETQGALRNTARTTSYGAFETRRISSLFRRWDCNLRRLAETGFLTFFTTVRRLYVGSNFPHGSIKNVTKRCDDTLIGSPKMFTKWVPNMGSPN